MKLEKQDKRSVLNFWTMLCFSVLILTAVCCWGIGNVQKSSQIFHDFLVGEVAYTGTNKTGEWTLFWGLLVLGCLLATVFAWFEKAQDLTDTMSSGRRKLVIMMLCFCPLAANLLIYGKTTGKMGLLTLTVVIIVAIYQQQSVSMLALYVCLYFAMESFLVLFAIGFHISLLDDNMLLAGSLCIFAVLCLCLHRMDRDGKKKLYEKCLILLQLPIPLLFLLDLKKQYLYEDTLFTIDFPKSYVGFILLLTVGCLVYQIKECCKTFRKGTANILYPTVLSVFSFVSYMPPAMLMQSDLHHHGEQILPWQQIVELGQKAYAEYSPASGLFPMLLGAINQWLFGGQATAYGMSYLVFALIFEAILMYVLYRRLGGKWTVFVAVLFHMPVYCRTWLLLPVLLVLTDKKLAAKRMKWILAWIFLCFVSGLYYPIFGTALLVGTLPFGLVQVVVLFRKKEWKNCQWYDWLLGGGLLVWIGCSFPLLYRMLKHVQSMAGQTLDVDGRAIVGYEPPQWFMPYLSGWKYYELCYDVVRFLLGIIFVMAAVYLLVRYCRKDRSIHKWDSPCFAAVSSVPIVLCICYTYTMICMDEDWVGNILSRSGHVILMISGLFGLVIIKEYGRKLLGDTSRLVVTALILCIPFFLFYQCDDYGFPFLEGATDEESYVLAEYSTKLQPYEVQSSYVMLTDEVKQQYPHINFDKIGEGFIKQEQLEHLEKYAFLYSYLRQYDEKVQMTGFEQSQFYYYLLDEKAVYSGRTAIAKSAKASESVIAAIDTEHTVVRQGISSLEQYYLYRYLVQSGYAYSTELGVYLPPALYRTIYGSEGSLLNSPWAEPLDCGLVANSFGKSVATMETCERVEIPGDTAAINAEIQDDGRISMEWETKQPIEGETVDFIYIRLRNVNQGRLTLYWNCLESEKVGEIQCDCGNGEVLIPVGANASWLTQSHNRLELTIEEVENAKEAEIEEVAYYHLK